jgi:hypothetical protein
VFCTECFRLRSTFIPRKPEVVASTTRSYKTARGGSESDVGEQNLIVSNYNRILFLFIETVRNVGYVYICVCLRFSSKREEGCCLEGVRCERMYGC